MNEVVAVSTAKKGGPCKDCRNWIERGRFIAKISTEGKTTSQKQGPGRWVCEKCSERYEWEEGVIDHKTLPYHEYRPVIDTQIDLRDEVPLGFKKGMRYSVYQQRAYQLGYYHGHQDGLEKDD